MAIIKCKMCGGDIELSPDKTFGTCEYCGSVMTLPKIDDDQRAAAFNRGNHFRRQGDFDKALAVYERIVGEDDTDAEAHWCCALCRYGIEYVEDPETYEYLPTCHRASFDSILEDVDYLAAVEYSDGITRRQYQKDAAKIAEVQRGILTTSQKEEPFDVFICYKETDAETGERSRDSIDAQEIYYQLTESGYRTFFSRITLEDKAGTEYEPYIFAALNSAKVMIVLGEKPEHFSAVWVKNEWSRFLSMMKKDRSKLLLPCYKNMDPYDLPEQLAVLQSYDMGKIGFIQDLIRGITKVIDKNDSIQAPTSSSNVVTNSATATIDSLLKRAFVFLEDRNWDSANQYAERVLDIEPENGQAYLVKLLAELQVTKVSELIHLSTSFEDNDNYQKVCRYDKNTFETIKKYNDVIVASIQLCEDVNNNDLPAIERDLLSGANVNYVALTQHNFVKTPVLILAIANGSVEVVKLLLSKGADPNCERVFTNGSRYSALRDSIFEWPNDEIARLLIDAGADVNYVEQNDKVKVPVLISAICKSNVEMVKLLLSKGANPNCERVFPNGTRDSALSDSISQWPNNEIARLLIDAGADVNYVKQTDKVKAPVLISAISESNVAIVKLLLSKGADPNCERVLPNGTRDSALSDSIDRWPNDEIARLLIDAGADVNYVEQNDKVKVPVLISAICKSNVEMVKLLLSKGANPNCERVFPNGTRDSALSDSISQWPNNEIARLLIDAGADVNYVKQTDKVKAPVLISAISESNVAIVKLLLSKGADPNCERVFTDGKRFSALRDSIAEWPNDEIARLLIDAGADVNCVEQTDKVKAPVLFQAIAKSDVELVKLLLSKGANPNSERIFTDGTHHSALRDSIIQWTNNQIVELLCSSGARIEPAENNFQFSSKEHLSKETIHKLKAAGYRFKLFG